MKTMKEDREKAVEMWGAEDAETLKKEVVAWIEDGVSEMPKPHSMVLPDFAEHLAKYRVKAEIDGFGHAVEALRESRKDIEASASKFDDAPELRTELLRMIAGLDAVILAMSNAHDIGLRVIKEGKL